HVTWRQYGIYRLPEDVARQYEGVWLGGTREQAGFDLSPTVSGRQEILEGVARLAPGLTELRIRRHAAALRPVTPDGLPLVGKLEGLENAFVATGAGTKGMLISAGMADSVVRSIAGREQVIELDRFDPARFARP